MDLVRAIRQAVERRMSLSDFDGMLDMIAGGGAPSYTGKLVGPHNALGVTAWWKCINVLSDDYASVRKPVYRWTEPGVSREQARDHYLWPLLNEEANPRMSSNRFFKTMEAWRVSWGNAYAEVETNGRGQILALYPWRPDRVKVWLQDPNDPRSELFYSYIPMDRSRKPITLHSDLILHVRWGLSLDGLVGLSPIEVHRQTLGLSMAMTEHAARFYGNGAVIKGVLRHPGVLGEKGRASLETSMDTYRGLANSHRMLILEEGMEYQEIGMKLQDAQFIESMGYTDNDIAGIAKVPPHRIGILDKATFSNITQQAQEYINYTLGPNADHWTGEMQCSLLSGRERQSVFIDPDYSHLLEGDYDGLAKLLTAEGNLGALAPDEVREMRKRNPLAGGIGKIPRVPLNTAPLGSEEANNPQPSPAPKQEPRGRNGHAAIQ